MRLETVSESSSLKAAPDSERKVIVDLQPFMMSPLSWSFVMNSVTYL